MISQRPSDGFVNLTEMARTQEKRVSDYLELEITQKRIQALAKHLQVLPSSLVIKTRGRTGGSWAHPQIAIDFAQWCSVDFWVRATSALVSVVLSGGKVDGLSRMLEVPIPGDPIFEAEFEEQVSRVTGLHKNHIRNAQFYWEFVYFWLAEEERSHLNEINPVLKETRRRKYKIHDCLQPETKIRLAPYQLKMLGKLESCNSVSELRRMFERQFGRDQKDLFDGWNLLEGNDHAQN
jgi:KilA-N domain